MKPLFSIVVPVYNSEKYLEKCLKNLVNQTHQDIEIILVNDGSRDKSQQICEEYAKDHRVTLINKENGGVSKARNTGIEKATGEYIIFVDSDDVPYITMCEEYKKILDNKKYDLIISNLEKVTEEGKYVGSFDDVIKEGELDIEYFKKNVNQIYIKGIMNCPVSKCFRKEKIKSLFDPKVSLGEDLLFNLNFLINCHSIYYLDKKLYKCIVHKQSSLSSKYREDGFKIISFVYEESLNLISKFLNVRADQIESVHKKYMYDCIVMLERIARNTEFNKKEKICKISKEYEEYLEKYNFKNNILKGWKWKIYYYLLKKKNYKGFVNFSNLVKRR